MKKIGIVGAGFIAAKHAAGVQEFDNLALAGVTAPTQQKSEALVREFGGKLYISFEDMLVDDGIDIVVLCVPSHMHKEFALKAIAAKKPFLLEKPMALTSQDALEIASAAKAGNVPIMVGQNVRFRSEYARVRELIAEGVIGDVKLAYAARLGQRPTWATWYSDSRLSGGVLFNISLHDIDYLYSVFQPLESVYAVGARDGKSGCEDILCTLKFASGVKAVIDSSAMMTPGYPFTMRLRVDGTRGALEYVFIGGENTESCKVSELLLYRDGKSPEVVSCAARSSHGAELSYFADCLEKNAEPSLCPPDQCVKVAEVLEAVETSLKTGEVVRL